MNREICWNITARCNQNCKYCHRFLRIKELSFDEQNTILDNLIKAKVTDITWTGGEALLVEGIEKHIEKSYLAGIKNKLITNGKLLNKETIDKIIPYLDSLTLSIDSIEDDVNIKLGRGKEHFKTIDNILNYMKDKNCITKVKINIVVNKYNHNNIKDLILYLNKFNIYSLRLFKFMPLREKAIINQDLFDITEKEFFDAIDVVTKSSNINNIEYRMQDDMQKKYILILADGNIVITTDNEDKVIGNAVRDSINEVLYDKNMV